MEKRDFLNETFPISVARDRKTGKKFYMLRSELKLSQFYKNVDPETLLFSVRGDCGGLDSRIEFAVMANHNADLIMNPVQNKELIEKIKKNEFVTVDGSAYSEYEFYESYDEITYKTFMASTETELENIIKERRG